MKAHTLTDEFLDGIDLVKDNTDDFKLALRKVWLQEEQESFNRIKQLKIRLGGLQDEKSKIATGIVLNPEIKDDLLQSLEQKKHEITELEREISDVENIEKDFVEFTEFSIDYIQNLKKDWWELEHSDRLECKQLITKDKIFINFSEKVYTPEISPILKLIINIKEADNASKNRVVEGRQKFWNTFFNIILSWEPILRQIKETNWSESYHVTTYQAF